MNSRIALIWFSCFCCALSKIRLYPFPMLKVSSMEALLASLQSDSAPIWEKPIVSCSPLLTAMGSSFRWKSVRGFSFPPLSSPAAPPDSEAESSVILSDPSFGGFFLPSVLSPLSFPHPESRSRAARRAAGRNRSFLPRLPAQNRLFLFIVLSHTIFPHLFLSEKS